MGRWSTAMALLGVAIVARILQVVRGDSVCEIRQAPPRKNSPPLRFCSWYRASSCCLPAHDADMNDKFLTIIEAGPTCEKYHNPAKLFLAMAFCYGCAPDQPSHFGAPLNTRFFNASVRTAKICRSITDRMAPRLFGDCGLLLPDDREQSCSPNSAVVPELVWSDCVSGQYVCFDPQHNWICSDIPCEKDSIPRGFANVPCDETERTCDGVLLFLNDNRAAKPPYFEDYAVEIVDEDACRAEHANASVCKCLRPPVQTNGAPTTSIRHSAIAIAALLAYYHT